VGEAHLRSSQLPKVTAHGMRGLHSTLAVENGVSAHELNHESSATTIHGHVKPEAVAGAQQRRVMTCWTVADSRPEVETIGPRIVSNRRSRRKPNELVEMNGIEPSAS
jgi:hypothetical protein